MSTSLRRVCICSVSRMVDAYSRTALFSYEYPVLSAFTYGVCVLWKQRLKQQMKNGGENSLIIITTSTIADAVVKSILNHNYERYQINGIIVVDKDMTQENIEGIPVVANAGKCSRIPAPGLGR